MLLSISRGGRRRAWGGGRLLGRCSRSHLGRLLMLPFNGHEWERNGVGDMGSTGDLVKTGDGNTLIGTGCAMPSTWGLMEVPYSQFILTGDSSAIGNMMVQLQQQQTHPGALLSSSNTCTACQMTAFSRAPHTRPQQQLDIGRSFPSTTTVPTPAC